MATDPVWALSVVRPPMIQPMTSLRVTSVSGVLGEVLPVEQGHDLDRT
ncbi:MAG: hypothetical protein U0869_06985 [Chloroflexota bacterium]